MSGVHGQIAIQAAKTLPPNERAIFERYIAELEHASWYPDHFADRKMPLESKMKIDPEADRYIYPERPTDAVQTRIDELTENEAKLGISPLRSVYLAEHYLPLAVEAMRSGDEKAAVKFCGVYSHTIGDTAEPIHAVHPSIVDLVVPPPPEYAAFELHAGLESLKAPVNIEGYQPQLLGTNVQQAVQQAYVGLVRAAKVGASQAVPMAQAIYTNNRARAVELSSLAQNESARNTADFMHTVMQLASSQASSDMPKLDLCNYPYAACSVDMLYRYRPTVDVSLIPYSGKNYPLSLRSSGGIESVHGLGMVPYLGPPYTADHLRQTSIEYFMIPGAYRRFKARVGVNPLFENTVGAAIFTVLADGQEIARSPEMNLSSMPFQIEADLSSCRWLTLKMHYSVNPTFEDQRRFAAISWALHGVWAEPVLE